MDYHYRLAKDIRVPVTRIAEICQGKRSVTADTALRLAKYFGMTPKFWLGLQGDYDLEEGARYKASEIDEIRPHTGRAKAGLQGRRSRP